MADASLSSMPGFTILSTVVEDALEKKINDIAAYATLDLSQDLAQAGETVTSYYVSTLPTVATKSASASYADGDFALTPVSVSLGIPIYAQISVDEVDMMKAGNVAKLETVIANAIILQMSKAIEDKVLGLVTASNFTNTAITSPLSAFDFAAYRNVVATGFKAGYDAPVVALNSDYIAKLEATQGFYGRTSNGNWDDGSKLVRSDRIPTTGNLTGFITNKSALVVCGRALSIPSHYGSWSVKTTKAGLNVRYGYWYDEKEGKNKMKCELLLGASKGNPAGLTRIVSA